MTFHRTTHKKERKKKLIRSILKTNRKKIQTGKWIGWVVYPSILGNSNIAKMLKQLKSEKPAIFSSFTIPTVEDPLAYVKEKFNPIERLTNYYMHNWSADTVVLAGLSFELNPTYWYSRQPKYTLQTKVDIEAVKSCLRFDFRKKYESVWPDKQDRRIYERGSDLYYQQLSKRPDRFRFSKDLKAKSTIRLKLKQCLNDESF